MREQTVSGREIDDAAAAKEAPDATRHLPGFVQLLARQTASVTDRACKAIEQRVARKPLQVTIGEAPFRRDGERHEDGTPQHCTAFICTTHVLVLIMKPAVRNPTARPLSFVLLMALVGCGSEPLGTPSQTSPTAPTTVPAAGPVSRPLLPGGLHMTVSPIDLSTLIYIIPLGAMNPWGHTLPTDHVYFYHHDPNVPSPPVPVYAPAAGWIENTFNGSLEVRVDPVCLYRIGPLALADGIVPGARVEPGTLLGHHSVFPAFDFSVLRSTLQLNFVNPLRYGRDTLTADGPLKYFDEPVRSALVAKVRRTGGEIYLR